MAEMTAEDTIKLLQAKAASAGDSFRIKVFRLSALRPTENTQVALLSDAVLAHATNPELWMPQLCGGGVFAFFVYHLTDPNQYVGGPIRFNVEGEPRAVNPEIVFRADWQGPKKLDFPPRVVNNGPSFSVASTGSPTGTAPQTLVPSGQAVAPQLASDPNVARALADLQRETAALQASRAALDAERHKLDIERIRQENDMRMQQLENRLTASKPVEHKADTGATIAAIATALTPLVQTIITGQNDLRREMMKIEQERANQTNLLLTKIMDRPERPLIDPMIEKILDKATTPTNQPEAIASMTAAMGSMAEVSMGMIQQVAEMQSGGQEHWGLQAAREVAKGIGALAGGMKVKQPGQKQVGPGGPPQTRAGFAQAPPPPPPQQRGNGAVATQQHQPPAAAVPAKPAAPVKSAPVNVQGPDGVWREVPADQVNVPPGQQTINAQPVSAPAQPVTVTQYAAQAQQEPVPVQHFEKPVQQPQVMSVIDSIKVSITQYMDVRQLANAIIDSLPDPEFQKELDSVDQSFSALAAKHLSEWVHLDPRNPGYLKELFDEVERQGVARGVFDTGDDDDVSDQDTDGDEGGEGDSDQGTSDNAG